MQDRHAAGHKPVDAVFLFAGEDDAAEINVADRGARLDAGDEVEIGELLHVVIQRGGEQFTINGREGDDPSYNFV